MKAKSFLTFAIISSACILLSCRNETLVSYWPTREWKSISPKKVGMDEKLLEGLASIQNSLPKIAGVLAVSPDFSHSSYEKAFRSGIIAV